MKKTLAVIALTGSMAVLGGGAAMATTYPAPAPAVAVSDGTVAPGETFTFSGAGFTPGETVDIIVSNEPAATGGNAVGTRSVAAKISLPTEVRNLTAVADASGNFSVPIALTEKGRYTITAKGLTSGKTQTATVVVVGNETAANAVPASANGNGAVKGGLADTGAEGLALWGTLGGAALVGGIVSVVVVRRKAANEAA